MEVLVAHSASTPRKGVDKVPWNRGTEHSYEATGLVQVALVTTVRTTPTTNA